MKVTVILIVFSVLGTVSKGLEKRLVYLEIKRIMETVLTTELLRSDKTHKRVLET